MYSESYDLGGAELEQEAKPMNFVTQLMSRFTKTPQSKPAATPAPVVEPIVTEPEPDGGPPAIDGD
jgi:hypothetical protein